MRKTLLALVSLIVSASTFATPFESNEVPTDFTNDIMLNTDYREMQVGSTYKIVARRLPEVVDNPITNNEIFLPEFTYEVIEGSSVLVDATTGIITANTLGKTIFEVGYKAMNANDKVYDAISPINKTYLVVNVVDSAIEHGIDIATNIVATSYDTYYYTTGVGFDLHFTATATANATLKAYCNGEEIKANSDGSYNALLRNRANIIEIEATNTIGTKHWAKVIDARRVRVNVANISTPDSPIYAGDSVQISLTGIVPPIYKLASYYNPCMESPMWGSESPKVRYLVNKTDSVKTNVNVNQYFLNEFNTMGMRLSDQGEYFFHDGVVRASWYGQPIGTEKEHDGKLIGGPAAPTQYATLSKLPAIRINVLPVVDMENNIVDTLLANNLTDVVGGAVEYRADSIWDKTYDEGESYSMLLDNNFVAYHLPSGQTYDGMSWEGFTVSRQQETDYFNTSNYLRQFSCTAGGGVTEADAPYLMGYFSWYQEMIGSHSCQVDLATEPREMLGAWVCPANYMINNALFGAYPARPFAKGDTLSIVAHGLDADGNDNGQSVVHYFIDYRDAATENRYVQTDWQWMDLSGLGNVSGIYFTMESSDSGDFGPNTPTYFALDGLRTVRSSEEGGGTTGCDKVEAYTLSLYPNPVRDLVHITAEDGLTAVVYNLQGQVVTSATIIGGQINLSHLIAGVYVVRVGETAARIVKL